MATTRNQPPSPASSRASRGRACAFLAVRVGLALVLASVVLAACTSDPASTKRPPPGPKTGATAIHEPPKLTSIETGKLDGLGRPIRVACVTCHSARAVADAGAFPASASDLHEFHKGLKVEHGALACTACHVNLRGGEPRLHLADGTDLATGEAMRLCAQCHGPKYETYLHGGHGGMTGQWDLSSGGRSRNHCVDCHDPHVPRFEPSHPVLPPRDRKLVSPGDDHG